MYIGLYTGKGKYQEVAIRLTKDHISKYWNSQWLIVDTNKNRYF